MRVLWFVMFVFALPVYAQQLSDKYLNIGQMDTIYDGVETSFFVPTIPEDSASFAEIKIFMGREMLSIIGVSAADDGSYASPMLAFTLALDGNHLGAIATLEVMEAARNSKHPTETAGVSNGLEISNFSRQDSGEISFDFSAKAVRMVLDENWDQAPEEGMPVLPISGHVYVVIPASFIEKK